MHLSADTFPKANFSRVWLKPTAGSRGRMLASEFFWCRLETITSISCHVARAVTVVLLFDVSARFTRTLTATSFMIFSEGDDTAKSSSD